MSTHLPSRPIFPVVAMALVWSLPLLLAGCEAEAVDLVREIEAARGDCTAEGLKRTDDECVRMMERYAGMGTELVHTYIGGLKALDVALDRMPPPAFDTAGLGYALSPEFRPGDPFGEGASPRLAPAGAGYSLRPAAGPAFARGPYDRSVQGAAATPAYARAPGERLAARPDARARAEARQWGGPVRGAVAYGWRPSEGRYRDDARERAERRERLNERWRGAPFGYGGGAWGYGDAYRYLESGPEGYFNSGPYGYFYDGYFSERYDYPGEYGTGYGYGGGYGGYGGGYGYGFGDPRGYDYGYDRGYGYSDPAWYAPYDPYRRDAYAAPGYGGYGAYGADPYGYDRGYGGYDDRARTPYPGYPDEYGDGRGAYQSPDDYAADMLPPSGRTPAEDWGYAPAEGGGDALGDNASPAAARAPARPAPHRPGILLPPEERLRRPWLED